MKKVFIVLTVFLTFLFMCGNAVVPPGEENLKISEVSVKDLNEESAKIAWKTNKPATGQVMYGTSNAALKPTSEVQTPAEDHEITLSALLPGTKYYYKVLSRDDADKTAESDIMNFTTENVPEEGPKISNIRVVSVTSSSAMIAWETDMLADSRIEYGKTTSYNLFEEDTDDFVLDHYVTLTGLEANQGYHFMVTSTSKWDKSTSSDDQYFETRDYAKVGISPDAINASVGETIELEITLENVVDVFVFGFELEFDSRVIEYVSKSNGPLVSGAYDVIQVFPDYENSKAHVGWTVTWQIQFNGDEPIGTEVDLIDEKETVMTLRFKAKEAGMTTVKFKEDKLILQGPHENEITSYPANTVSVNVQ